jgi:hypothetical protein
MVIIVSVTISRTTLIPACIGDPEKFAPGSAPIFVATQRNAQQQGSNRETKHAKQTCDTVLDRMRYIKNGSQNLAYSGNY